MSQKIAGTNNLKTKNELLFQHMRKGERQVWEECRCIGHVEYKETVALHMDALHRQFSRSLEFHINPS